MNRTPNHHTRGILLCLRILLILLPVLATPARAVDGDPRILILSSYHQGEAWSDNQIAGILPVFRATWPDMIPAIEYMDAKRFPGPEYAAFFEGYLRDKHKGRTFDLLMVLDNAALDLVLKHRGELFPGTPVVFAGINGYKPSMIEGQAGITGVAEVQDVEGTLRLALKLHPRTRKALAVHDHTSSGLAMRGEMERVARTFAGQVEIAYTPDAPWEEVERVLKALTPDSVVLLLTYVTDTNGRVFTREESTRLITQASPVPVYAMHETRFGYGIVGGPLLAGETHGRQAAEMAVKILKGAPPDTLPVETSRSRLMFDYNQLEKFLISEKALPEGSIVTNRSPSYFDTYKSVILPVGLVIAALSALIGLLALTLTRKRKAEEKLRASEEKYRTLFDAATDAVFILDMKGNFIDINRTAHTRLGYTKEEMLSMNIRQLDPPEFAARVPERLARIAENGEAVFESAHCRKDRSVMPVEVNSRVLDFEGQQVYFSIIRDITERKQAEEALRRRALEYESILSTTGEGFWMVDDQGRIRDVNEAYCRMSGFPREELLSMGIPDLEAAESPEEVQRHREKILRDGFDRFESRHRTKDGRIIDVEVSATHLRESGFSIGFIRDITDRKQIEEALKHRAEEYESILATTGEGFWMVGEGGRLLDVNEAYCRMSGFSREELLSMVIPDLEAAESPEEVRRHQEKILGDGFDRFESRHRTKDGRIIHVEVSVTYLRDRGCSIGFIRDITDRKLAAQEKDRLQAQLAQAQKMESIGRLAGGVAHDFNNMLSVILGHTELALARNGVSEKLAANLGEIETAARRSADLTRQLLAFARKQTVAPRVLNINEAVEGMLKMLRRLIGEDIHLTWLPAGNPWPVEIDPAQVDQILANLCVNARDAISGVGRLTIETHNEAVGPEYSAQNPGVTPGDYVMIAVSDDGCGMSPQVLEHIFEPFFTTKEAGQGTGLGLATVYGIVKQNGGFINVYSEPDQGTTFKIYLPRHTARAAPTAAPPPETLKDRGHETILVVEDEAALLEMTRLMLEQLGYRVIPANTSAEAIRLIQNNAGTIDLLMTDVIMPEVNGRELADRLMALAPGLRCLFMSGYTADVISRHGVLEPGVHFIQKPFSMKGLSEKVRETLAGP